MGYKAEETTFNINNTFGPWTASECTVQCWFKKFCKRDLEDEEHPGWPLEVDDKLRAIIKTNPLTTMWEAAKELNVNHSTVFQLLKQTGEVKKLSKWVPHEWTENQKDCCFEASSSLILCNTNKLFLDDWIVMCSKKSILYNWWWPAWWLDREEALPKATIAPKKVMVTVWWSAAGLIHNRFLNPGKNHYIWEVCSANQWDSLKTARPAANIGEQNGFNSPWQPTTSRCTTNASKVEIIDLGSFASFIIFTWPLASWLPLLQASRQLFAGKMLPQ